MDGIQFPNATLNSHWSRGHVLISRYTFSRCNIKIINSFETELGSSNHLELEFKSMSIDTIQSDAFYFEYLSQVSFRDTTVENIDIGFIARYHHCLKHFEFDILPIQFNLNKIFDGRVFKALTSLAVSTPHAQLNIIDAANFTNLPHIQNLELNHCGIKFIRKNAFNSIAHTLETLFLRYNQLLSVHPWTFNAIINRNLQTAIKVDLSDNKLNCDCNFLELIALGAWYERDWKSNIFEYIVVCIKEGHLPEPNKCENVQVIQPKKFSLPKHYPTFIYSKFNIHVHKDRQNLWIRTPVQNRYRVWMYNFMDDSIYNSKWGYSMKKCLAKGYLQSVSKCLIINAGDTLIPIEPGIDRSEIKMFCISYVYGGLIKMFWPLHCRALGPSDIIYHSYSYVNMLIYATIIIVGGFSVGLLGFLLQHFLTPKKNTLANYWTEE